MIKFNLIFVFLTIAAVSGLCSGAEDVKDSIKISRKGTYLIKLNAAYPGFYQDYPTGDALKPISEMITELCQQAAQVCPIMKTEWDEMADIFPTAINIGNLGKRMLDIYQTIYNKEDSSFIKILSCVQGKLWSEMQDSKDNAKNPAAYANREFLKSFYEEFNDLYWKVEVEKEKEDTSINPSYIGFNHRRAGRSLCTIS